MSEFKSDLSAPPNIGHDEDSLSLKAVKDRSGECQTRSQNCAGRTLFSVYKHIIVPYEALYKDFTFSCLRRAEEPDTEGPEVTALCKTLKANYLPQKRCSWFGALAPEMAAMSARSGSMARNVQKVGPERDDDPVDDGPQVRHIGLGLELKEEGGEGIGLLLVFVIESDLKR